MREGLSFFLEPLALLEYKRRLLKTIYAKNLGQLDLYLEDLKLYSIS
jgi:hypothetical protein